MAAQNAYEREWEKTVPEVMAQHFSGAVKKSHDLKTTDTEPVSIIVSKLDKLEHIDAVDVGCGAGRYDMLLYRFLGDKLQLTCLDANADMFKNLSTYLTRHGIKNFSAKSFAAENMPFSDNSLDCVFTFNTIHRLNMPHLLAESARVLKSGGIFFVYSKINEPVEKDTREQISGLFGGKEKPPFSMDLLKQALDSVDNLFVETIVFFAYNRIAAMEHMFFRDRTHRVSTFTPYTPESMEQALKAFSVKIRNESKDMQSISWFDENVLFIIKKN